LENTSVKTMRRDLLYILVKSIKRNKKKEDKKMERWCEMEGKAKLHFGRRRNN
jgi:hypothetical protein